MLATQNPVDLDYKGLSNAGTWFLGRLQTERDKARVLDGLEGASAAAGRALRPRDAWTRTLSGLGSRVFLMNNVHDDAPVVFQTRWAMSYLRGPLTREQIRDAGGGRSARAGESPPAPASAPRRRRRPTASERPVLPARSARVASCRVTRAPADAGRLVYRPALLASARSTT